MSGGGPLAWLHDSRRLLYLDRERLFLAELESRSPRELLAPPPSSVFKWLVVSADDRSVFLVRQEDEGDVWSLTLD
jgi:hypothetical protein